MKCPNCKNEMKNTIGGCYYCEKCGCGVDDAVYRYTNIPPETTEEVKENKLIIGDPYVGIPGESNSMMGSYQIHSPEPNQLGLDGCKCIIADDFEGSIDDQIEYYEKRLAELKAQKGKDKWKFTEDEKVILRNLPEEYKWIAREETDELFAFIDKPHKSKELMEWVGSSPSYLGDLGIFNHIFQCIQWSDTEPCEFRKYI